MRHLVTAALLMMLATPGIAQTVPENVSADEIRQVSNISLLGNREIVLSLVILVFGIVIVLVQYFLLRTAVERNTENIANTNVVTLIIIGTLVLITAGFNSEQIAPALGLFGTIAGYILGKGNAAPTSQQSTNSETIHSTIREVAPNGKLEKSEEGRR